MVPGTIIIIAPNVKHWHGASKDEWFSHLAIEIPGEDSENLNASEVELTDEEFAALAEELSMHRVYGHRGLGGF